MHTSFPHPARGNCQPTASRLPGGRSADCQRPDVSLRPTSPRTPDVGVWSGPTMLLPDPHAGPKVRTRPALDGGDRRRHRRHPAH